MDCGELCQVAVRDDWNGRLLVAVVVLGNKGRGPVWGLSSLSLCTMYHAALTQRGWSLWRYLLVAVMLLHLDQAVSFADPDDVYIFCKGNTVNSNVYNCFADVAFDVKPTDSLANSKQVASSYVDGMRCLATIPFYLTVRRIASTLRAPGLLDLPLWDVPAGERIWPRL